jgi:hypothetical protein
MYVCSFLLVYAVYLYLIKTAHKYMRKIRQNKHQSNISRSIPIDESDAILQGQGDSLQDIAKSIETTSAQSIDFKKEFEKSVGALKDLGVDVNQDGIEGAVKKTLFSPRKKEVVKDSKSIQSDVDTKENSSDSEPKPEDKKVDKKEELTDEDIKFGTELMIEALDYGFHALLKLLERKGDATTQAQIDRLVNIWSRYIKSVQIKMSPLAVAIVSTFLIYGYKGYKSKPAQKEKPIDLLDKGVQEKIKTEEVEIKPKFETPKEGIADAI